MRIPRSLAGPSRTQRRYKSTEVQLPPTIEPRVTTLPNKIRVITEPAPGHINTVALTIDAGTRYESPKTSGVTHLLDKLAWQVGIVYRVQLTCRAIHGSLPMKWRYRPLN